MKLQKLMARVALLLGLSLATTPIMSVLVLSRQVLK
jgi:hypothetical protein